MAQSKPLPDNHTTNFTKEYGQQQQQLPTKYLPATPSPLSPRSSDSSRPASLPRRHTLSGPTPTPTSTATAISVSEAEAGVPVPAATPIWTRRPKRHKRRHSGSPTERLMRHKAALAWRSMTTSPVGSPCSSPDISPLRRHPVQGFSSRPSLLSRDHKDDDNETGGQSNPHQSQSQNQFQNNNEKADSHFVVQLDDEEEEASVASPAQQTGSKDTSPSTYNQRDQRTEYPYYQLQYGYSYNYGTNFTTSPESSPILGLRHGHPHSHPLHGHEQEQGLGLGLYDGYHPITHKHKGTGTSDPLDTISISSSSSSTTTLQRAALIAASVFFCGIYIAICAFSMISARGHDHLSVSVPVSGGGEGIGQVTTARSDSGEPLLPGMYL